MDKPAVIACVVLLLSGCVAAPADRHVELPEQYVFVGDFTAPGVCSDIATDDAGIWMQRALDGNFDLKTAVERVRQADAIATISSSALWPTLGVGIQRDESDAPFPVGAGFATAGDSATWQGSVAASYEVDLWGMLRTESSAARLDGVAARQALETARLTIQSQTLDSWLSAVAQEQLVGLLDEQRKTSENFLELTRLRFALGQAPARDIGRQKQQLLGIDGQREIASGNARLFVSQLEALTGVAPGTYQLHGGTLPVVTPVADPGLPADVIARRPDVQAAAARLEAADLRTAAAVRQRLPSLNVSASLVSIENAVGDLFRDTFWSLGTALSGIIFDGGRLKAQVSLQDAQADEAFYDYSNRLFSALREVHDALIRAKNQDSNKKSLEARLEEANKVLVLTRDAYRQGQASYLDILNALSSTQTLQRELIDATRMQLVARIDLCRAAGIAPGGSL